MTCRIYSYLLILFVGCVHLALAQLYKDVNIDEPVQVLHRSDFSGKGCPWPEPPRQGYNFEKCGKYYCLETPGTVKPHGTHMTTLCQKHYVMAHGEREAYCDNGAWSHKDYQCLECGRTTVHGGSLIHHGIIANPRDFPWAAGIYLRNSTNQWVIACGGTLISTHVILTAAHCFKLSNGTLVAPENVKVGLGKLITDYYAEEKGALLRNVREIVLPSRYIGLTLNFALDIALLDLEEPLKISYGSAIMPACIDLEGNKTLTNEQTGFIAGFGKTEEGVVSDVLKWAPQKYIDYQTCVRNITPYNVQRLVPDKFCIKNVKGSRADKGDSGGGITFLSDNIHYVHGVVSFRLTNLDDAIVLFTNVFDHRHWLLEQWDRLRRWHFQNTVTDINSVLGDVCKQANNRLWYCQHQSNCSRAVQMVKSGATPESCNFIGNSNDDPVVCCEPDTPPPPAEPSASENKCREFGQILSRQTKTCNIFRRSLKQNIWSDVGNGEFPHLALISNDDFISFRYATLISEQYLLSDALYSAILKTTGSTFNKACVGVLRTKIRVAPKYDIVEVRPHPEFRKEVPHKNNIALFRLKSPVQLTTTVRPLCLHREHVFPHSHAINIGNVLDTEDITILSKQNTTILPRKACKIADDYIDETLICVKMQNGANVENSGGLPLVQRLNSPGCMYRLVGISNFYTLESSEKRSYTRTSHYVKWIESVVWPR